MNGAVRISEAAKQIGVSPHYLRLLEWEGRTPAARRDLNGRFYTPFDIALLKSMGVGRRPQRLLSAKQALEGAR